MKKLRKITHKIIDYGATFCGFVVTILALIGMIAVPAALVAWSISYLISLF